MATQLSSAGICKHNLLPYKPSIHLSAINSSPHSGIAPQSLTSSSQLLLLPGDLHPCQGYEFLRQGLPDSHFIQASVEANLWISYFTLSLKCFSSDSDNCPNVGIRPLLQFPHLPRAGPVLLTLLFFPLVPLSYRVLGGSIYSFPLARSSYPLSAGVLHALLCLKVYSWCIHGERCTPRPPTPQPSCSPILVFLIYLYVWYFEFSLNRSL